MSATVHWVSSRQPKISQLCSELFIQQYIARFHVSVDDRWFASVVQILQTFIHIYNTKIKSCAQKGMRLECK